MNLTRRMRNTDHTDDAVQTPDVVIITGLSGSGMSSAMNAFEDRGYFCVDNLPLTLLPTFARLVRPRPDVEDDKPHIERAALVINIREGRFLREFQAGLDALRAAGLQVFVLFLEASDEVLLRRFSETRRPHPAEAGAGLLAAVQYEREAMRDIRLLADTIIDSSEHTVHTLRRLLLDEFTPDESAGRMQITVLSFGHKHGMPRDVDLLFDVRHLPNPYFVADLRHLSGHDPRVVKYLRSQSEVQETLRRLTDLLEYLLPLYEREGKAYCNIGIGCTGGRHRSVMIANELARRLRRDGFKTGVAHRDVRKSKRKSPPPPAQRTIESSMNLSDD